MIFWDRFSTDLSLENQWRAECLRLRMPKSRDLMKVVRSGFASCRVPTQEHLSLLPWTRRSLPGSCQGRYVSPSNLRNQMRGVRLSKIRRQTHELCVLGRTCQVSNPLARVRFLFLWGTSDDLRDLSGKHQAFMDWLVDISGKWLNRIKDIEDR